MVLSREPLRLLMTPSGFDKGSVEESDLLEVDENAIVLLGSHKASAEALIHVAIAQETTAQVILHTHSVANTLLSFLSEDLEIAGYEMLKALEGNTTHETTEVVPIFNNSQEMVSFSVKVKSMLEERPEVHGFLMRGHGLYTWGDSLFAAKRHLEALEFMFEVEARRRGF